MAGDMKKQEGAPAAPPAGVGADLEALLFDFGKAAQLASTDAGLRNVVARAAAEARALATPPAGPANPVAGELLEAIQKWQASSSPWRAALVLKVAERWAAKATEAA